MAKPMPMPTKTGSKKTSYGKSSGKSGLVCSPGKMSKGQLVLSMPDQKLPRGAGPGTDNSLSAGGISERVRKAFRSDIRLPSPTAAAGRKAGMSAMKTLLSGNGLSKGR